MADQRRKIHQPLAHEVQGAREGVLHAADESDREALPHGPDPGERDLIRLPITDEDEGPPGPNRIHRLHSCALAACRLEGDVHALSLGPLPDRTDHIVCPRIECRGHAE